MKQEINNYIYCLEIYSNNDKVNKLKRVETELRSLIALQFPPLPPRTKRATSFASFILPGSPF